MNDELKPCPFCGKPGECIQQFVDGPPQQPDGFCEEVPWGWTAGCKDCEAVFWAEGDDSGPAIAAWNRRSPTGGQEAEDEARYRWWRANAWFYRGVNCLQYGWPRCGEIGIKDGADKCETIDAAIDAAMKESGK